MQDIAIWGRKQYRPRPVLCRSDGEIDEIGEFRRYCEQFYPDGQACNRYGVDGLSVATRR